MLQRGVVELAVVFQTGGQRTLLLPGRAQQELLGAVHGAPMVGRVVCSAMYRRIVAATTRPTEATNHDFDQRVDSRKRRWGNAARSARPVAP
jgi:hypothetical protein